MAVPVLQAEGAIANVTSGNLVITLPSYQADDIVVLTSVGWVPNTSTGTNTMSLASPWTKYSPAVTLITSSLIDGEWAFFWARATSNSSLGTTVTITRPTSWDTGNDTAWGGRAYVIRGCTTTGNPFDQLTATALSTAANPAFPAITVSGNERLPIVFYCSSDNNTAPTAASGWTIGTAVTDASGTDVGFQSYDIPAGVGTSTSAVTPTGGVAPAQGRSVYFGVSFAPTLVVVVSRTATGSGSGTETATGVFETPVRRTATGSGTGTESATRTFKRVRTATNAGTGTQSATWANRTVRQIISYVPKADQTDGNWTNSAANNTNMFSYVDEAYASPDGAFVRGATDTTDAVVSGCLTLSLGALDAVEPTYSRNRFQSARIRFRIRAVNRVDDTVTLEYGIVSDPATTSYLAGAGSTTRETLTVTSNTYVDTGWLNFAFVTPNLRLPNSTNFLQLRQVITPVSTADGTYIEIDAIEVEVTYACWDHASAFGYGSAYAHSHALNIAGGGGGNALTTSNPHYGQGVKPKSSGTLHAVQFYLNRNNSPTGNVVVQVYSAGTGTFGSTQIPGTLLATSDGVDSATMSTSISWVNFTFSGANRISLTAGTAYYFVLYHANAAAVTNFVWFYYTRNVTWMDPEGNGVYSYNNGTAFLAEDVNPSDARVIVEIAGATGLKKMPRTATGSGAGTATALKLAKRLRTASATGSGTGLVRGRQPKKYYLIT